MSICTAVSGSFAAIGLFALMGGSGSAQTVDAPTGAHFRLSSEALACFVQYREIYSASEGEPIYLLADRCPPERPHSLLETLTNEGPDVRIGDADALDRLVTLSRAQLACLDRLSIAASDEVVLFFPDACRVEPATGGR